MSCNSSWRLRKPGNPETDKHQPHTTSAKCIVNGLPELLTRQGWKVSSDARVALLYLIGKGKWLCLPAIIRHPIYAVAQPIVPSTSDALQMARFFVFCAF